MIGYVLLRTGSNKLFTNCTDDMHNGTEDFAISGLIWSDQTLADAAAAFWNETGEDVYIGTVALPDPPPQQ